MNNAAAESLGCLRGVGLPWNNPPTPTPPTFFTVKKMSLMKKMIRLSSVLGLCSCFLLPLPWSCPPHVLHLSCCVNKVLITS